MSDHPHDGHRQRMRERILQTGISSLQPHEVLEYLLYSFIPRKDTNEIAHALIAKFGSLSGVLNASVSRLKEVSGMTMNAAIFLNTLPDVFRHYVVELNAPRQSLKGRGVVRNFLGSKLYGVKEEQLLVCALDAHDGLIVCDNIAKGNGNSVIMSVRDILDIALSTKATSIIIAHNHPSGKVKPSQNDVDMTLELYLALSSVSVALQDHIIFSGDNYYSFEENGLLNRIKTANSSLKEGIMYYE